LEQAGKLKLMDGPGELVPIAIGIENGELKIPVSMEGQSVSLFVIEWN
jgi:hypothetical protein